MKIAKMADMILAERNDYPYDFVRKVNVFKDLRKINYKNYAKSLPFSNLLSYWKYKVKLYQYSCGTFTYGYYNIKNTTIYLGIDNKLTYLHEFIHAAQHKLMGIYGYSWNVDELIARFGSIILAKILSIKVSKSDYYHFVSGVDRYLKAARKKSRKFVGSVLLRTLKIIEFILTEHIKLTDSNYSPLTTCSK